MDESKPDDFTVASASWSWSSWEKQCLDELDAQLDTQSSPEDLSEETLAPTRLWECFEISAQSVAQLYKSSSDWISFQRAAGTVTQMYKESVDAYQKGIEYGQYLGHRKIVRDVLGLIRRSHKKYFHREDLLGLLCGKQPPPRLNASILRNSPRHRFPAGPTSAIEQHFPNSVQTHNTNALAPDFDMAIFKEALGLPLSSLSCSPSARSSPQCRSSSALASSRQSSSFASSAAWPHPSGPNASGGGGPFAADLASFFLDEWSRHGNKRKRSASGALMDESVYLDTNVMESSRSDGSPVDGCFPFAKRSRH